MAKKRLPDKNFKWTNDLAYVIGLITTDGNLSKDKRHIIMRSSDVQLLKTFKKCLGLSNKIACSQNSEWAKKPCYRVQFSDAQFYRWLLKIGLFPAKTYTIEKLRIPKKYFKDFLRGHLDGDGSIFTYKDHYNTFKNPKYIYTRLYVRFMSASKKHMDWLRSYIIELLKIKGQMYERKPREPHQTTSTWKLRFAKKDSIKLLSWIYYKPDIPCLERKRKIAEPFIN